MSRLADDEFNRIENELATIEIHGNRTDEDIAKLNTHAGQCLVVGVSLGGLVIDRRVTHGEVVHGAVLIGGWGEPAQLRIPLRNECNRRNG